MKVTPDLRRHLHAVAVAVIGSRVDASLLVPALECSLAVDVHDFVKYHPAEFAETRMRDHQMLLDSPYACRQPAGRRKKAAEPPA